MNIEQESALEPQETEMSVTPNDIRNAEFTTSMRGFNRDEVDEFLQNTATALEEALSETVELRAQHKLLQEKHEKLTSMEDSLKSTLLEAQKTADAIRANADRDVQLALERAHGKQKLIEEQALERINQLQDKVRELDGIRVDYQERIQETISSHLKIVEELAFTSDMPELVDDGDLSDLEQGDIERTSIEETETEEVTLFEQLDEQTADSVAENTQTDAKLSEAALSEAALSEAESSDEGLPNESPASEAASTSEPKSESQPSSSLHSDFTDLGDDHAEQSEKLLSPAQLRSTSEAIAKAVEGKSSTAEEGDDSLYKKLSPSADAVADEEESSRCDVANGKSAAEEQSHEKQSQRADRPKAHATVESGSDGIVVFGRKEDREKAVEENARILSELDSVVDKFAEELREIDRK